MGSSRVLVPARYVSIALVVSAPAGCLPRRATGEYSTPIAMTVAEADRVDALDEEARKLGDDPENPTRIKTVRGKGYLFSKHDWQ